MSVNQRSFSDMLNSDTTTIGMFEELKFLAKTFRKKRFRFWSGPKWITGGEMVYFIELTNDKANSQTTLKDFIKGANLTFFKEGWIEI